MRMTLRSLVLALAVLAAAAFTSHTAAAATVRVPFNFNINGKTLPAGDYSVTRALDRGFVTLKSEDGKQTYTWFAAWNDEKQPDPMVTLRFDESDGQYTLRSVQYSTLITGRLDKNLSQVHAIRIVRG
jgi:hypothetical protein